MSDSYIQLLVNFSAEVDADYDLLQKLSDQVVGDFDSEEAPVRCFLRLSPLSGIVWARGIAVSEFLAGKTIELDKSVSVTVEFPRNQPSFLVEIVPKRKNTVLDLKKFDRVFNDLKDSFREPACLLISETRIVIKFADPEEATKQSASFVEPMKEDGAIAVTTRVVLVKEHVVMRAFYMGGSQPFARYAVKHKEIHGQSMTDFVHSKFSHFKDRPVALGMNGLPTSSASTVKVDAEGHSTEEVNIVCATQFDFRLLRNSPPVVLPNNAGSLLLRVNADSNKTRKSGEKEGPVPPAPTFGPPALPPPPNLPPPVVSTASTATTAAGVGASSPVTAPTCAYIFWDYGSCPVDAEICNPEDVDAPLVATITGNIRGVLDRYVHYKRDVGQPIKITGFQKNVYAPQGNSFKNIDRIPPTWSAFTKNEYKVHHYSKKCSAEQLLRGLLESVLKSHRGNNKEALLLCFVTNDSDFASIAAFLKLEGQNDIVLIHNSAQSTVTSLVKKHYNWNSVQDIPKLRQNKKKSDKADKSSAVNAKGGKEKEKALAREVILVEKERPRDEDLESGEEFEGGEYEDDEEGGLVVVPPGRELVPWSAGDAGDLGFGIEEDPTLRKGKKKGGEILRTLSGSVDSGDENPSRAHQSGAGEGHHAAKVDLRFSSIATYIKKLMSWRKADEEAAGIPSMNYLMGEDTSGYDTDPAAMCTLRVDVNPKAKKFVLHIRGPDAAMVELRQQRIKAMVEECVKVRQLHNFTGWLAEHRIALIGSEVLAAQERACRACVLFHYSGATTVAEIVGLRQVMHNGLLKFVQKLKPKETLIEIPAAFVCWYDDQIWEKMRSCFAVKAEVIGPNGKSMKGKTGYISPEDADKEVKLKLWGFMPKFMEKAQEHIRLNDEREEIRPVLWSDDASANAAAAAMAAAANPQPAAAAKGKEKDKKAKEEKSASPVVAPMPAIPAPLLSRTVVAPVASAVTAALREETAKRQESGAAAAVMLKDGPNKGSKERLADDGGGAMGHKTVYTFADREAGRFFYSFDEAFRTYLDRAFSVFVDEAEHAEQLNLMLSGDDAKNGSDMLKVSLYGSSLKNVQAARAYMEQFTANVLGRHQIFFPRVSARKYKDILHRRDVQVQRMKQLRIKETAIDITVPKADQPPIDPLKVPGFINIRSRPPLNLNARVNFPLDVTITVCGSLISDSTRAVLDENKAAFNSIPSEFPTASIVIPPTHYMKQELTVKAEREELVKRFNLVAMRWEEGTKATGNVSIVRVWAYTKAGLKVVLAEILRTDMGGAAAVVQIEESGGEVAGVKHPAAGPFGHPAAGPFGPPGIAQPVPVPVPVPVHAPVPGSMVGQGKAPTVSVASPVMASLNNGSGSPASLANMQAGNVKIFANAKGAIKPFEAAAAPPPPQTAKSVIYLPDLSLRYVMQGDPLKTKLNELLERQLKNGAHIAYPYKDRTDPHACFLLEGENQVVGRASIELNEFIEKATRALRCVQIILNTEQLNYLTAGGEGLLTGTNAAVQELQVNCGVHLIFNPPPTSTREAFSLFDMRFATELVRRELLDQFGAVEPSLDETGAKSKVDREMMSVSVFNTFSQRSVEISIISSNSSESGWTWGVNNLLLLVGSNTLGFNPSEAEQLNRGEVLVHQDRATNKTILRIKPNALTRGVQFQAAVLTNALLKCLQRANELGLKGLAVSAPTDIDSFPELSPELIRSLTVEAVVEFAKKCRSYLRFTKLVIIELGNNVVTQAAQLETAATPTIPATMAALERQIEPTQRDRMVRTMTVLLERQEAEHLEPPPHVPYDPRNPHMRPPPPQPERASRISLLTCNVPLPPSMFTSLPAYERQKGFRTFLLKGMLSSVVKAVDQIKTKLATPKPLDDLPINVEEFF